MDSAMTGSCDDLVAMAKRLEKANLSVDGVSVQARRKSSLRRRRGNNRGDLMLTLKAKERTLKDKQVELAAIEKLLNSATSAELRAWVEQQPATAPSASDPSPNPSHADAGAGRRDKPSKKRTVVARETEV
ncbi:PREDICTED: uncharacterized protein LOC106820133 [Priapulus caudatus]|uniref:Uncharacterized protein LOC106820133 n=1 Tax=Priapulus caudatus TaxID=37621 RepID=A0ABM1F6U6_PRICU|nr:PREDICTED: uncharacterized protein LOC106820133 [Priapulus caudatus]